MEEELINFKTSELALEKGFDIRVDGRYYWNGFVYVLSKKGAIKWYKDSDSFPAPTQSLLNRWLREKYGVHIVIIPTVTSGWTYKTVRVISELDNDVIIGLKSVDSLPPYKEVCAHDFSTFEEAFEDGIYESLKLIKL